VALLSLAFGLALLFAGLVTTLAVSVVGAVVLLFAAPSVGFVLWMPVQAGGVIQSRSHTECHCPRAQREGWTISNPAREVTASYSVQLHPYSAGLLVALLVA